MIVHRRDHCSNTGANSVHTATYRAEPDPEAWELSN